MESEWVTYRVMVRIQGLNQHFEMPPGDQFVLHVGAVAHEREHPGTEDLQAVVSTVSLSNAGRAFMPRADDPFVHGDVVV